jgi:hypothetical protein
MLYYYMLLNTGLRVESTQCISFNFTHPESLLAFSRLSLRSYVSPEDKLRYSNQVPSCFDQVMCGLMLGDGSLRLNGGEALLSIQQTHSELVINLWDICNTLNLVTTP